MLFRSPSRNGAAGTIYLFQGIMLLEIAKSGTGSGIVSSSPNGISCGSACNAQFMTGSSVTLTASADASSAFVGWSGACSGTDACTVTMDTAKNVTATFVKIDPQLQVSIAGTGSGIVSILPPGIACNTSCSSQFPPGTSLTLHAEPAADSLFTEWGGGICIGTGDCQMTISSDSAVTANFSLKQPNPVRLMTGAGMVSYASLQAAYDAASPGNVIKLLAIDIYEDLDFNRAIDIAIEGGYDPTFNRLPEGATVIHGMVTLTDGAVILDRLVVQ